VAQHRLDDCATGSAVAVWERVDRLELGVRDCDLGQCRDVDSADECDEVIYRRRNTVVVRRNEVGKVRAEGVAADPHLFVSPASRKAGQVGAE